LRPRKIQKKNKGIGGGTRIFNETTRRAKAVNTTVYTLLYYLRDDFLGLFSYNYAVIAYSDSYVHFGICIAQKDSLVIMV
jgi:hypothetical protein